MTVQFLCPGCEKQAVLRLPRAAGSWSCLHCGGEFPTFPQPRLENGEFLDRCVVCAGERFYTQRDFNQRIGCVVAGIGAVLSPFTYGISLLVCLIIDLGLYFLLKQATLCYRCGAVYRGVPECRDHGPFDLHVADLEMHESKYLRQRSS